MKNVIVIGGGPAGMICAIEAAKRNNNVTILERNNKLGKKLYITGKGRCNITNASDVDTLILNTTTNPYFLYSSYYTLDSSMLIDYFEKLGVKLKIERGNRVFPVSDKSSDVIKVLQNELKKNKVNICLNAYVKEIKNINDKEKQVILENNECLDCNVIVIATGGLSYPVTGSTGDGYKFAKYLGHNITKLYPSLVPLKTKQSWVSDLSGLSLKNVKVQAICSNKVVYENLGEMLFTHVGITGPLVLSASRFISPKLQSEECKIKIDLKPALSEKELDNRILRDFEKNKNKDLKNSLYELLPQKLIPIIIKESKISDEKKIHDINKQERKQLIHSLKNLTLDITDTTGFNEAVITCGGINIDEINPSTMESKKVSGIFFAGEVLDVDAFTGGFNLQIAFSTGFVAGNNC